MPLSLKEMESHIYVDEQLNCGIRVNCKKSFIKSSIFKRQQAVLLIVYYLLNLEEKDAFKTFRGATIVHVLLYDTYLQTLLKLTFSVCDKYHLYLAAWGSELPLFNCSKLLSK